MIRCLPWTISLIRLGGTPIAKGQAVLRDAKWFEVLRKQHLAGVNWRHDRAHLRRDGVDAALAGGVLAGEQELELKPAAGPDQNRGGDVARACVVRIGQRLAAHERRRIDASDFRVGGPRRCSYSSSRRRRQDTIGLMKNA